MWTGKMLKYLFQIWWYLFALLLFQFMVLSRMAVLTSEMLYSSVVEHLSSFIIFSFHYLQLLLIKANMFKVDYRSFYLYNKERLLELFVYTGYMFYVNFLENYWLKDVVCFRDLSRNQLKGPIPTNKLSTNITTMYGFPNSLCFRFSFLLFYFLMAY